MAPAEPGPAGIPSARTGPGLPRTGIGVDVHPFADDGRDRCCASPAWPGPASAVSPVTPTVTSPPTPPATRCSSAAGLGDLGTTLRHRPARSWPAPRGCACSRRRPPSWPPPGFLIGNVSVQVIGNRPRLGPRREEAEAALSAAAGAPVSVAATTTDGLGLTGRGEGVAAIATALVLRRV